MTKNELLKIEKNKNDIITLLLSTKRRGMKRVIDFLENSNFFFQEGSYRHHRYIGGLAAHALGVLKYAREANRALGGICDDNSIIICAILHDICKISYKFTPKEYNGGHGSRSVKLLEGYLKFKLKDEERRAIRFHMAKRSRIFEGEDAVQYEIAEREALRNIIHESDNRDASSSFLRELFF